MAIPQEFKDSYKKVDDATTRLGTSAANVATNVDGVSTRVWALVQKLADSPTPEEVATFKDLMDGETDRLDTVVTGLDKMAETLKGIAKAPENPVPDPIPEPIPVDPPPTEGGGETPPPDQPSDPQARRNR